MPECDRNAKRSSVKITQCFVFEPGDGQLAREQLIDFDNGVIAID